MGLVKALMIHERTVKSSSKKLSISRYTGRSELAWRSTPWPLFPEFPRSQRQLFPCVRGCSRGDIKAKLRSSHFARRLQIWDFFSIFLSQYSHPLVCRAFFFPFGSLICSSTPYRVLFIRVWFISSACVRRGVNFAVFRVVMTGNSQSCHPFPEKCWDRSQWSNSICHHYGAV